MRTSRTLAALAVATAAVLVASLAPAPSSAGPAARPSVAAPTAAPATGPTAAASEPESAGTDAVVPPRQAPSGAVTPRAGRSGRTASGDGPGSIDVLFVYSRQARKAAGGSAAVRTQAAQAVRQANTSFGNSRIATRFRLVGAVTLADGERDTLGANLTSLWKQDGRYDGVPALRDRTHADLVHLVVRDGGRRYCGRGYLRPTQQYAYSVTRQECTTRSLSFAHEAGHNLGADHDRHADAPPTAPEPARGWASLDGRFLTVMAYPTRCVEKGKDCRRIKHFSNPAVTWRQWATGTTRANNAAVISGRIAAVAGFRQSRIHPVQPVVHGTNRVGRTLRVSTGRWLPGTVRLTVRWFVGQKAVRHGPRLTLKGGWVGKRVRVRVSGSAATYAPVNAYADAGTVRRR